jgi:hypothetical protein
MESGLGAVLLNRAGAHPPCERHTVLEVGGEDGTAEPVPGVVGERDGLFLILVCDDGEDRPDDLLLRDAHVRLDVSEDRGFDEPPPV